MADQGHGGSIIGISSISALVGGGLQTHYTPTKAGVLSLMQSCACALGKYKIRCNALLPGTIKTQLNEKDLENEEKRKYMEGRIPLGRTGVPEDLAGPAVFLASDLSRYVVSLPLLRAAIYHRWLTSSEWRAITRRRRIVRQFAMTQTRFMIMNQMTQAYKLPPQSCTTLDLCPHRTAGTCPERARPQPANSSTTACHLAHAHCRRASCYRT